MEEHNYGIGDRFFRTDFRNFGETPGSGPETEIVRIKQEQFHRFSRKLLQDYKLSDNISVKIIELTGIKKGWNSE
jgi:hypothetical protein